MAKVSQKSLENLKPSTKRFDSVSARIAQEKSAKKRKENNEKQKQYESFQLSSFNALNGIQINSLNKLAKKAETILENPKATPQEIKLATDILEFLRDSSGQKPTDKQEINTNQQTVINVSEKQIANVLKTVKESTYE